jgi:stearoyl-CoA desaturase (delta-9 desaturase)
LAAFGAGAVQGSIRFWAREHRAHHRYTDTDRDPYSIQKGFWYAHILWVIVKQPKRHNRVDISDITNDSIAVLQHKYYFAIALTMGWFLPSLVAGLGWHDWYGGFLYAGILRSFFVNQATFCVNSLAHYLGEQPFDDRRSPRDHVLTAIITMGEGYHNYHHSFPSDYRNGIEWYHIDITKWMISVFDWIGLAYDLKRFRQNEIEVCRIQQSYKILRKRGYNLNWGTSIDQLPAMGWNEYKRRVDAGESLVVIEGIVHDVASFRREHPGGELMIRSAIGCDATGLFNGAIYDHSNAARNVLATLRVAALLGGAEVEVLKEPGFAPDKEPDNNEIMQVQTYENRSL